MTCGDVVDGDRIRLAGSQISSPAIPAAQANAAAVEVPKEGGLLPEGQAKVNVAGDRGETAAGVNLRKHCPPMFAVNDGKAASFSCGYLKDSDQGSVEVCDQPVDTGLIEGSLIGVINEEIGGA